MLHLQARKGQSPVFGPELAPNRGSFRLRSVLLRVATYCRRLSRAQSSHLFVMSDDGTEIITGEQLASLLQVSPRTVEEWRRTRTGPPWRRVGRHVRYLRREVFAWFEDLNSDD